MAKLALRSSNVFSYSFKSTSSTNKARILIPDNPSLNLAGTSWTIECWVKPDGITGQWNDVFAKGNNSSSTAYAYMGGLSLTNQYLAFWTGASNTTSTAKVTTGLWNHVAWVFNNGANVQLYLNGTQVAVNTTLTSLTDTSSEFSLGSFSGANENYVGEISNFRIIKGQAIYAGNFNIPTFPFQLSNSSIGYHAGSTNVAASLTGNVVLLTCNSDKITSNGNTVFNLYPTTEVTARSVQNEELQNFSYFFPGNSSATSVQNATVIATSATNSLNLNTDFTIETWFYPTKNTGTIIERGFAGPTNNVASYIIRWDSANNQLNFASANANNGTYVVGSLTGPTGNIGKPILNQWNHIAVTHTGTSYFGFLNGTLTLNITNNANVPYAALSRGLTIGGNFLNGETPASAIPSNTISGYISNMRIIRGNSIYNASFTPANTQLLSNSTNVVLLTGLTPSIVDVTATQTLAINGMNEIFVSTFSPFTANAIANANNSGTQTFNYSSGKRTGKIYNKIDPSYFAPISVIIETTGTREGKIYDKFDGNNFVTGIIANATSRKYLKVYSKPELAYATIYSTTGNRLKKIYPKSTGAETFSYMPMVGPSPASNINYQFWS
jgi:Concanavalin A-like lectin/glucanases superfamily